MRRLEAAVAAEATSAPATRVTPAAASATAASSPPPSGGGVRSAPAARPARPARPSLEDLVGGRLLAWAGGAAVLVGLVLLAAVAVSHGWLGEGARTAFAGALSAALFAAGVWLHERRGRTDAARAAAAAGVAGLFVTAVLGARVYDLLPLGAGVALAALAGASGVALALRWDARGLAGLGLLGALAAPAAVGAGDGGAMAMLWVMAAGAAALLLVRGWDWLALAAYSIVTPQWIAWLLPGERGIAAALAALAGFGALALLSGIGFELRTRAPSLRPAGAFIVALNAAVLAAAGWAALRVAAGEHAADAWLAVLAAAHVAATVAARRSRRVSTELVTLLASIAAVLSDIAVASVVHGAALPVVWVAGATIAAAIARGARERRPDASLPARAADLGVGAHVALAVGHALVTDAPFGASGSGAGVAILLVVAAGCVAAGRLAGWQAGAPRIALDAVGLAAVTYLIAAHVHGAALAAAWAAEAVALAAVARRTGERSAGLGALALLMLAGGHALAFETPPTALVDGPADRLGALVALTALAGAAVAVARTEAGRTRAVLLGAAAVAVLHLASAELIGAAPAPHGQMLLSALWALAGTGAVVAGLRRDLRPVRLGGLALLLVTAAKVFAFDLAALDSGWRVGSFLVLGVLLLAGAFAWQRLRPRPAPDLRRMPAALRS
jgi:uncharacterized membrane protein